LADGVPDLYEIGRFWLSNPQPKLAVAYFWFTRWQHQSASINDSVYYQITSAFVLSSAYFPDLLQLRSECLDIVW